MSQLEFLTYAYDKKRASYRVVGGPRGFVVTFHRSNDLTDEQLERQQQFAREVLEVKPLRRRRTKVNHERARALFENAGERAIGVPDKAPTPTGNVRWLVRIYYRSEGDELLCFDAGPYTYQTADRIFNEYVARPVNDLPSVEVFDRAEVGADAIAQGTQRQPSQGARLVVLPSQRHEPVVLGESP